MKNGAKGRSREAAVTATKQLLVLFRVSSLSHLLLEELPNLCTRHREAHLLRHGTRKTCLGLTS